MNSYGPPPDSYLVFQAPSTGDYYIGVSGEYYDYYYGGSTGNYNYDPTVPGSGAASSTGDYKLQLLADTPAGASLSIADASASEADGSMTFVVSLSEAVSQSVTLAYTTADGTATSPSDYTATSGTLTFAPGELSKTITVPVIDDSLESEPGYETFTLTVSNVVGVVVSRSVATGTIANDDFPVGDAPGDNLAAAMVVSLQANQQTEISATIGDGNYGSKDVDLYRVSLVAGQTLKIDVDAEYTDDDTPLSSLDSYLRVFNASGTELATNSSGAAANDSSYGGMNSYGAPPDSYLAFQAPSTGVYYIGISGEFYDYYYGNSTGNYNYDPTVPGSGEASSTGDYRLQLLVDTPPTPKLSVANASAAEASGTVSVQVTLSPISDSVVSVDFATAPGSAVSPADFGAASGTLVFNPGESSKTIVINLVDDSVSELNETLEVWLSNPSGAELLAPTGVVTVINDDSDVPGDRLLDAQPVTLVPESLAEFNELIGDGLYGAADVDLYRVQLAAGQALSVDLDAAFADDGTVLSSLDGRIRIFDSTGLEVTPGGNAYRTGQGSSENDYEDPDGNTYNYTDDFFVFTPSQPGTYYVSVSAEANSSFDPTVVNSGYAANTTSSTGAYRLQLLATVAPVPTLSVVQQDLGEDSGAASITVKLDYPSAESVSVDYSAMPGTASSPADYVLSSGTLVFPPGTVEQTIPISIVNDTALEGTESFQLVLSNPVGAPIAEATTAIAILDDEPNPIQNVHLVRDTGHDRHDRRTVNPEVTGQVVGSFGDAALRVEFDHDGDGTVDGFVAVTNLPTDFIYDPRVSEPDLEGFVGNVPLRYRFAMTESNGNVVETSWVDFAIVMEEVPTSAYVISGLTHSSGDPASGIPGPSVSFGMKISGHVNAYQTYYGDGYSSSDGSCNGPMGPFPEGGAPTGEPGSDFANPYLGDGCGPSSGDETVEGTDPPGLPTAVTVEIDLDMDGESDVTTTTDANLDFSKFFATFDTGSHTIQARALEWNNDYGMYLKGAWASYSFTWENASAPDVAELKLLNDTGDSDSDLNTQDPRITGTLEQPFQNVTGVQVEFDLNGDGTADGQAGIDDNAGFQFTPQGLAAGWRTVSVRSSAWDQDALAIIKGAWRQISFNYSPLALPEVQGLALLVDDGESSSDRVTTNATLIGTVTPADGEQLTLFFDFDQDGNADTLLTPQEDGQFLYNALELQPGQYTIDVWATRFSTIFDATETGPTQSFSFTLEAKPQSTLAVTELALVDDTGINKTDLITSNPTISGKLVNDGSVAQLTVEIDVNADGVVDGTTTTDNNGYFQFTPTGLALGPKSIAARGVAYNHATSSLEPGAWNSLSFSLVASTNEAAVITELRLLNDSGVPADGHTEDPRLTGRVLSDSTAAGIAVELDIDGDGNA
ncbi:MAG: Calx-beta domain-containing protein, partial [Aureliella sp.]